MSLPVEFQHLGEPPLLIRLPPPQLEGYKPFYGSQYAFEKMILDKQNQKFLKSFEMSFHSSQDGDDEAEEEVEEEEDGNKPLKLQKITDEDVIEKTGFNISQICELSLP